MADGGALGLTAELIERQREELKAASGLTPEALKQGEAAYDAALVFLKTAAGWQDAGDKTQALVEAVPDRLSALDEVLEATAPDTEALLAGVEDQSLTVIETSARQAQQALADAKARLVRMEESLAAVQQRPEAIQKRVLDLRDRLAALGGTAGADGRGAEASDQGASDATPPDQSVPAELVRAQAAARSAERTALQAELSAIERERLAQDVVYPLRVKEREAALKELADAQAVSDAWQQAEQARRQAVSRQRAQETQAAERMAQLQQLPDAIQALASENVALSKQITETVDETARTQAAATVAQEKTEQLTRQFKRAQKRIDASGLDKANGLLLRRMYDGLPDYHQLLDRAGVVSGQIGQAETEHLDLEDQRLALNDLSDEMQWVQSILEKDALSQPERAKQAAERFLLEQARLLQELQAAKNRQIQALLDLDEADRGLLKATQTFDGFIRQRLLWAQSSEPFAFSDLSLEAERPLMNAANWQELWGEVVRSANRHPFGVGVLVLGLLVAVASRRWIHRRIRRLGQGIDGSIFTPLMLSSPPAVDPQAGDEPMAISDGGGFGKTLWVLAWSVVCGASVPLLLMAWASVILSQPHTPPFTHVVIAGVVRSLTLWAMIDVMRCVFLPGGLAEVHLGHSSRACRSVRLHLTWAGLVLLYLVIMVAWVEKLDSETYRRMTGRPAFLLGMLAIAGCWAAVLRPTGPLRASLAMRTESAYLHRGWATVYGLGLVVFAGIMGLALQGYYYTAIFLQSGLNDTVALLAVVWLIHDVGHRWVRTQQSRLAEQLKADNEPVPGRPFDEKAVRLRSQRRLERAEHQMRTALRAGLAMAVLLIGYMIWLPALPALQFLENVTLWTSSSTVDGQAVAHSVTLADLALTLVLVLFTVLAARSVPGVLEITILTRLPIEPGARFAITTICRYVLIAVGVMMISHSLGVQWDKLQWLVAALSVGLGFGLQEIVANFVSGLIVLFERPFRLGDLVTIGTVTGRVTRIQIRATTITNRNRQELIVPNKDFITGQVINWSLSDPVTRIAIPLTISHQSDAQQAKDLLLQAAVNHELVLDEPEPSAVLKGMVENGVMLELRVFVGDLPYRAVVTDQLVQTIHTEFERHGIQIARVRSEVAWSEGHPEEGVQDVLPVSSLPDPTKQPPAGGGQQGAGPAVS